jgi:hypothetical protein
MFHVLGYLAVIDPCSGLFSLELDEFDLVAAAFV